MTTMTMMMKEKDTDGTGTGIEARRLLEYPCPSN